MGNSSSKIGHVTALALVALLSSASASAITVPSSAQELNLWQCDDSPVEKTSDGMPVCVTALPLGGSVRSSSPLIWFDDAGFWAQPVGCAEPFNVQCAVEWITAGNNQRINGVSVMPPCQDGGDKSYCIKSFVISGNRSATQLEYLGQEILSKADFSGVAVTGDSNLGIPKGGRTSYWLDPLRRDIYSVSAVTNYYLGIVRTKPQPALRAFTIRTDIQINRMLSAEEQVPQTFDHSSKAPEIPLPLDVNAIYQLALSFPDGWGGFAGARISELDFKVIDKSGFSELVISGKPMEVTGAHVLVTKPSLQWNTLLGTSYPVEGASAVTLVPNLGMLDSFKSLSGDRASGVQGLWGLNVYPSSLGCGSTKANFTGFASSNALFQDSSIPKYSDGFFTYQVGDFHYRADGSLNRGQYYFGIDSDLARCLYGFSSAPISGTISIINEDGEKEAAVTRVYEKDGLLRIDATNFTYSTKTIRAKISGKPGKINKVKTYSNCKSLNQVYPGGVARAKNVKNKGPKLSMKPAVSSRAFSLNVLLDKDKDGIVCEK